MNKRPNYRFLQYLLYKVDVQNGGTWASTVNSKSMNLISTQVYSHDNAKAYANCYII